MTMNNSDKSRLAKNARIVVEVSCQVKENETVVILARRKSDEHITETGPNIEEAYALSSAAYDLKANPIIIDITDYSKTSSFAEGKGLEAIGAALRAVDVVIGSFKDYKRLGLGEHQSADVYHTGKHRWMSLQSYMSKWDINAKEVEEIFHRTEWLSRVLEIAHVIRVTSSAGTDFTFSPMKYTPVLAIVPNYGEIAITPLHGSESGVIVTDGPTQNGVRRADELDRQPLKIWVEAGEVKDFVGDPVQVERLEKYINSDFPPARSIDEVGIPTTRVKSNDICWYDGTHSCKSVHIALGNNSLRNELIHGPLHIDCEIIEPTISIDGKIILKDGKFVD